MPLDKFAPFDVLPAPKPLKPGIATVIRDNLLRIADNTGGILRPQSPSPEAFRIIACLGQVRDALLDQKKATLASVNSQLRKAKASKSANNLQAALAALDGKLAEEFAAQFAQFEKSLAPIFETARRDRIASLIAFEAMLTQRVK